MSNPTVSRTRSLRIPPAGALKIVPASAPLNPGTSNVALFLTNLRLLNLDQRDDWPGISAKTFSTKDAQQNQKKRIQCVEWALFQLFALWDPEETQNKLQPFFPPLEPLQSLNLRAALFRCLDQAKKNGILGRDTVLRKTMLDECKGERLDEVLAVFSNAVLKKVLVDEGSADNEAIAQQVAFENFSYTGERAILSTLILAHKASLKKHINGKDEAREKYKDFSELLILNERRVAQRHEQLKGVLEEQGVSANMSARDLKAIQNKVQKSWTGSEEWLGTILYGDSKVGEEGLLATRFDKVWKHVEDGTIADTQAKGRVGLLEQLDARVKSQENRLARWQDFSKGLLKVGDASPPKKAESSVERKRIDLGFKLHQDIQVSHKSAEKIVENFSPSLEEYNQFVVNMKSEIAEIRNPKPRTSRAPRQSLTAQKRRSLLVLAPESPKEESHLDEEEGWSSASEDVEHSPEFASHATKSMSRTPPSEAPIHINYNKDGEDNRSQKDISSESEEQTFVDTVPDLPPERALFPSPMPPPILTPPRGVSPTPPKLDTELDLANQILNSMSAASPSPKKPRHTLSLAERTRLSMARTSHAQISELDDFDINDAPRLSLKTRQSLAPRAPVEESDLHAGLIERTRKSMAGFEAAQKKAQLERRRSVKNEKKKARESTYFPKVEEEVSIPDISAIELIKGDPDYEDVFKSRPKIATSPAISPTKLMDIDSGDE